VPCLNRVGETSRSVGAREGCEKIFPSLNLSEAVQLESLTVYLFLSNLIDSTCTYSVAQDPQYKKDEAALSPFDVSTSSSPAHTLGRHLSPWLLAHFLTMLYHSTSSFHAL